MSQEEELREDILDKEYIMTKSTNVGVFATVWSLCLAAFWSCFCKVVQQYLKGTECKEKYILNLVGTEEWVRM